VPIRNGKHRRRAIWRAPKKKAKAGELVLLSQDEARFPMVPTLCQQLGVKGHRPLVPSRDDKDLLHVLSSVNCVTGRLHTRTLTTHSSTLRAQRLAGRRQQASKTRRMQSAFAVHLQDVLRAYPRQQPIKLVIDNAPWHRGRMIEKILQGHPNLRLYRLPPYSPVLNVIERFWKPLRRRCTHNTLFDTVRELRDSIRNGIRHYQRQPTRMLSLISSCYDKRTVSSGT
jgi:transposase